MIRQLPMRLKHWLIPSLMGVASFFIINDWRILNVRNVGWLQSDQDSLTSYLGWAFFRETGWHWPVGLNPLYGVDNSIVYSDSIPWLALFFKSINPVLPHPFQYLGPWLLVCFVLQAVLAWSLIARYTKRLTHLVPATALFLFFPALIYRLANWDTYHLVLVGQWLLLLAIKMALAQLQGSKRLWWLGLLTLSLGIHGYFFAMICLIWASDAFFGSKRKLISIFLELMGGLFVFCVVSTALGYWTIRASDIASFDYGYFQSNVLGVFDSSGWSYILPNLHFPSKQEGMSFPGIGVLVLYLITAVLLFLRLGLSSIKRAKKVRPLLLAAAAAWLFALSNSVYIGNFNLVFPFPESFLAVAGAWRASGRFTWIALYLLLLISVVTIVRAFPKKLASIVLIAVALIQIVDTSAGWTKVRTVTQASAASPTLTSTLTSPFWKEALTRYDRIMAPLATPAQWEELELLVAGKDIHIFPVNSARNSSNMDLAKELRLLKEDHPDPNTLYVFPDLGQEGLTLEIRKHMYFVDHLVVYVIGWKECSSCSTLKPWKMDTIRKIATTPAEALARLEQDRKAKTIH